MVAVAALLCAAAAGCASGGSGSRSASAAVGTVSRSLPGCTTAAQAGPELRASATTMTTLAPLLPGGGAPGPFGVAVTAAGNWGFATSLPVSTAAAVPSGSSPSPPPTASPSGVVSGVDVLRLAPGQAPVLAHTVAIGGVGEGAALSPDGRLLLVADGAGAVVISVPKAEKGSRPAVLGSLLPPGGSISGNSPSDSAIEVAITPDGKFAFVSMEVTDQIEVFDLARAFAHGFNSPGVYIGSIGTDYQPVGLAVSPDGRWLYATGFLAGEASQPGILSAIDVTGAESDPAGSVVSNVAAGCTPVRVITSSNGSVVWVTAQTSNALLAFSAARLQAGSANALLADVRIGRAPAGLALARGGTLMVVSDSNRYASGYPVSSLAVVNVADALAGKPALLGYLRAGRFPRDVAVSANGSLLLVANFSSGQVEEVNAAALP